MPGEDRSYARVIGARLRTVRVWRGMSLDDVERATAGEFKTSALGAYERGERLVSIPRVQRLARFYGVAVDQLLVDRAGLDAPAAGRLVDLSRVEGPGGLTEVTGMEQAARELVRESVRLRTLAEAMLEAAAARSA